MAASESQRLVPVRMAGPAPASDVSRVRSWRRTGTGPWIAGVPFDPLLRARVPPTTVKRPGLLSPSCHSGPPWVVVRVAWSRAVRGRWSKSRAAADCVVACRGMHLLLVVRMHRRHTWAGQCRLVGREMPPISRNSTRQ